MLTTMTFKNNISTGDPMAGVEVKLGSTSRGIIATGITDRNGMVEFKNIPEGRGYYMDYGIKEQGIKSSALPIRIEGIESKAFVASGNRLESPQHSAITKKAGDVEITVTVIGNMVRGIINVSRSNIKQ